MKSFRHYKHCVPIQLRFSDVDLLNHVNNACYHSFFELARVTYFNEALGGHINWKENGFILARTELDHIEPVYLDDELYCFTSLGKIGTKSITMLNSLVKMVDGNPVETAACVGILVAMDYRNNTSIPVPDLWRQLFSDFGKKL